MTVFLNSGEEIKRRIENRSLNLCVVGIGTIGLPVATLFADKGFKVWGLDADRNKVDKVNEGCFAFEYSDLLKEVIKRGNLVATANPEEAIPTADIIILCLPTPIDENKDVNLSYLSLGVDYIIRYGQTGLLVIVESSVPVGVTRELGNRIERETDLELGKNMGLVYCPERYNPGLPKEKHPEVFYNSERKTQNSYTLDRINRIIGGVDRKSVFIAKTLYSQIISADMREVSSIETAEATKVFENIFRDVNVALVNELAKLFPKLGLDIFEIIDAAKTKPFAFLPHYPGAGVGGECIPVDTWYLIKQAEAIDFDTKMLKTAREVNDSMPHYVVHMLENALKKSKRSLERSNVCILGVAYKENIADTRNSPAFAIRDLLKDRCNVFMCDPLVEKIQEKTDLIPLEKAFDGMDAILMVTDHDVFNRIGLKEIRKKMRTPIIIDCRNFYEEKEASSLGFIYMCVGSHDIG